MLYFSSFLVVGTVRKHMLCQLGPPSALLLPALSGTSVAVQASGGREGDAVVSPQRTV